MFLSVNEQLSKIKARTFNVTPLEELEKKLKKGIPLKIKLGADPTAPDLHLGHTVVLEKMKDFQDLGHEVIFLIGNFTALIGDPTGKSKTRPPLSPEQIQNNAKTYFEQVFRILNKDKTTIVYNADWLQKFTLADTLKMCSKSTLMRVIEREDFKNRISQQTPIGFHELLYPFLQSYDSVFLVADVELGGTDQTFNLLFGRDLQMEYGQEPQIVITMPILEGLDGKNKMSKSLNNYVGLNDSPEDAYGKLMSIPDECITSYKRLILQKENKEIEILEASLKNNSLHPMEEKKKLAFEIVEKYWGREAAQKGAHHFTSIFQKKDLSSASEFFLSTTAEEIWIIDLLKETKISSSNSEARRLVESNAVWINQSLINNPKEYVNLAQPFSLKVGKKAYTVSKK